MESLIILGIISLFLAACLNNLDLPGPYPDEAWTAVHSTKLVAGKETIDTAPLTQISLLGRNVPFMRTSYVGPVKTYLAATTFALFGISVPVLRITAIFVGMLALIVAYLLMRRVFGRTAATFSAVLLATDLSYIIDVRLDLGPATFGFLARITAIFLLLLWYHRRQRWWLLFLGTATLGLGLSHKFDFLSSVVAIGGAFLLFYGWSLRPRLREVALASAGFLVGAWPVILYNILTGGKTFQDGSRFARVNGRAAFLPVPGQLDAYLQELAKTFERQSHGVERLLEGSAFAAWVLGEPVARFSPLGESVMPLLLKLSPLAIILLVVRHHLRPWLRPTGFLCAVLIAIWGLLSAMPLTSGPHHYIGVYPLPHLLIGIALAAGWHAWHGIRGLIVRGAIAGVMVFVLASNLLLVRAFYERVEATGGHRNFSDAIYQVHATLQQFYRGHKVMLLSWGFDYSFTVLGKDTLTTDPIHWRIAADSDPSSWLSPLLDKPNQVFVVHAPNFLDPKRRQGIEDAIRKRPDLTMHEQRFFQRDGQHVFSILMFTRARAASPEPLTH